MRFHSLVRVETVGMLRPFVQVGLNPTRNFALRSVYSYGPRLLWASSRARYANHPINFSTGGVNLYVTFVIASAVFFYTVEHVI